MRGWWKFSQTKTGSRSSLSSVDFTRSAGDRRMLRLNVIFMQSMKNSFLSRIPHLSIQFYEGRRSMAIMRLETEYITVE